MGSFLGQAALFLIGLAIEVAVPIVLPPEKQRTVVRVFGVLAIAVGGIWFGYELAGHRQPPVETYHTVVSASQFPLAESGVSVRKGDLVEIIVQGEDPNWYCYYGHTSPEGIYGDRRDIYFLRTANLCELVGHITQDGVRFRVGVYERFEATESGMLYLGANDVEKDYTDPPIDNYGDNSGLLSVQIKVYRGIE